MAYLLDDQICFTLYSASMAVTRMYKPMLDRMGVTYPQYLVLTVLGERDGQTIGAIAGRLALESSTVTPPAKRLEQAGLVVRRRNQVDERQVQVWLTEAGRAVVVESQCLGDALIKRSGLSAKAVSALNRKVARLRDALVGDH